MILPYLNFFLSFRKAPVTWTIFALNLVVFMLSYTPDMISQYRLEDKLKDEYFMNSQGRLYAQFVSDNSQFYSPMLRQMARKAQDGDKDKLEMLGSLALRNEKFVAEGPTTEFKGDQVAIDRWKRTIASVNNLKAQHPSYLLGVSSEDVSTWKWFSYIFIHSGLAHFLGNMMFFLIFGCFLEPIIGGLALLVLFLGSGALAAGFYLLVSGASAAPLVGASGAVSGMMAFFCFLYWNKPTRFFYWLFLPIKGFAGFIYLPAWTIFAMWIFADLAGFFSTVSDFGGVAYTAHLGGEFVGIFTGLVLSFIRRQYAGKDVPVLNEKMGVPHPLDYLVLNLRTGLISTNPNAKK